MSGPGAIARRVVMAASRFCPAARRESGVRAPLRHTTRTPDNRHL